MEKIQKTGQTLTYKFHTPCRQHLPNWPFYNTATPATRQSCRAVIPANSVCRDTLIPYYIKWKDDKTAFKNNRQNVNNKQAIIITIKIKKMKCRRTSSWQKLEIKELVHEKNLANKSYPQNKKTYFLFISSNFFNQS